jgi:Flavodoxin
LRVIPGASHIDWWNTVAPPVMTLLTAYDLSGKTIAPFITHEGSGLGRSAADIAKLCPDARMALDYKCTVELEME